MKFPTCVQLHGSFCFLRQLLHSIKSSIFFSCWWAFLVFGIFNRVHTFSELGKPLKNLCSSHYLLFENYFQHLENFHTIFPVLIKILCRHVVLLSMKFSRYVEFAVLKEKFLIYVSLTSHGKYFSWPKYGTVGNEPHLVHFYASSCVSE